MTTARSGHATYYLDVALVSQNQAGNYSTLNVHIYAVADSGWSGYASGIGWSCYGGSGTFSFNGTSIEIANYNVNVGHDANGYGSWSMTASVGATGTSTYGGPLSWSASGSLPRIPKAPGVPGIAIASVVTRTVTLSVSAPADNGGATITKYTVQYSTDGGTTWGHDQIGNYTYSNLPPGTYKFRVWATNSVGNSGYATTGSVTLHSGGKVMEGATEHAGVIKVRVGGAWRDAVVKVREGGTWRDAL